MSKTTDWILDMEQEYYELSANIVSDCETMSEFVSRMSAHKDLVAWKHNKDLDEELHEMWNEFWSKYQNN